MLVKEKYIYFCTFLQKQFTVGLGSELWIDNSVCCEILKHYPLPSLQSFTILLPHDQFSCCEKSSCRQKGLALTHPPHIMHKAPPKAPRTSSNPPSAPLPRKPNCNLKIWWNNFSLVTENLIMFGSNVLFVLCERSICLCGCECECECICLQCMCMRVLFGVGGCSYCAGFYCSPWWAQRGRLVFKKRSD